MTDKKAKKDSSAKMQSERRRFTRYVNFARVHSPDLCVFPGVLIDISLNGCQLQFPVAIDLDMDKDYEVTVVPNQSFEFQQFVLIVHPVWISVKKSETEIGFEILHSPGSKQLKEYFNYLQESNAENFEDMQ